MGLYTPMKTILTWRHRVLYRWICFALEIPCFLIFSHCVTLVLGNVNGIVFSVSLVFVRFSRYVWEANKWINVRISCRLFLMGCCSFILLIWHLTFFVAAVTDNIVRSLRVQCRASVDSIVFGISSVCCLCLEFYISFPPLSVFLSPFNMKFYTKSDFDCTSFLLPLYLSHSSALFMKRVFISIFLVDSVFI